MIFTFSTSQSDVPTLGCVNKKILLLDAVGEVAGVA